MRDNRRHSLAPHSQLPLPPRLARAHVPQRTLHTRTRSDGAKSGTLVEPKATTGIEDPKAAAAAADADADADAEPEEAAPDAGDEAADAGDWVPPHVRWVGHAKDNETPEVVVNPPGHNRNEVVVEKTCAVDAALYAVGSTLAALMPGDFDGELFRDPQISNVDSAAALATIEKLHQAFMQGGSSLDKLRIAVYETLAGKRAACCPFVVKWGTW